MFVIDADDRRAPLVLAVIGAAAQCFDVEELLLLSRTRQHRVSHPRMAIIAVLADQFDLPHTHIAGFWQMDHGVVRYAVKTISQFNETDIKWRRKFARFLRAVATIRRQIDGYTSNSKPAQG